MTVVKQVARVVALAALSAVALAVSVAIGALAVSPNEELRIVAMVIGGLCVTAGVVYVIRTSHRPAAASRGLGITPRETPARGTPARGTPARGARQRTDAAAASRPAPAHGARVGRTPKAVEALAMAGTAPAEISWRTGLPVDAVAMLLALSNGARPLSPGMS